MSDQIGVGGFTVTLTAGDSMLDPDGNVMLDPDGNPLLMPA